MLRWLTHELVQRMEADQLNVGGSRMKKWINTALLIIGILLFVNGIANIVDDSRVLTYDITSILSGTGFILVSRMKLI